MPTKLNRLLARLVACARRERGAALVEYAFVLAIVSIACIALLTTIGLDVTNPFGPLVEGFQSA
jgi:Flp pilus assembly pilin Flp